MLYSQEHAKQQRLLHKGGQYGIMGQKFGPMIGTIIDMLKIDSLLDYGCGKNLSLTETLKPKREFKYQAYDIGVPESSAPPKPAQMVACIDVIEHIEPDCLEDVLDHIQEMTEKVLLISVYTGPARKVLADGRNAHLIQQPLGWWFPKFDARFSIQSVQVTNKHAFFVIARAVD